MDLSRSSSWLSSLKPCLLEPCVVQQMPPLWGVNFQQSTITIKSSPNFVGKHQSWPNYWNKWGDDDRLGEGVTARRLLTNFKMNFSVSWSLSDNITLYYYCTLCIYSESIYLMHICNWTHVYISPVHPIYIPVAWSSCGSAFIIPLASGASQTSMKYPGLYCLYCMSWSTNTPNCITGSVLLFGGIYVLWQWHGLGLASPTSSALMSQWDLCTALQIIQIFCHWKPCCKELYFIMFVEDSANKWDEISKMFEIIW